MSDSKRRWNGQRNLLLVNKKALLSQAAYVQGLPCTNNSLARFMIQRREYGLRGRLNRRRRCSVENASLSRAGNRTPATAVRAPDPNH